MTEYKKYLQILWTLLRTDRTILSTTTGAVFVVGSLILIGSGAGISTDIAYKTLSGLLTSLAMVCLSLIVFSVLSATSAPFIVLRQRAYDVLLISAVIFLATLVPEWISKLLGPNRPLGSILGLVLGLLAYLTQVFGIIILSISYKRKQFLYISINEAWSTFTTNGKSLLVYVLLNFLIVFIPTLFFLPFSAGLAEPGFTVTKTLFSFVLGILSVFWTLILPVLIIGKIGNDAE